MSWPRLVRAGFGWVQSPVPEQTATTNLLDGDRLTGSLGLGFDAAGVDKEFFASTPLKSLLVINIGVPGPDAWFPRLPRLDYEDVVTHL